MEFTSYVRAGYPMLWLQTFEEERAIKTLSEAIKAEEKTNMYKFYEFDIVDGFKDYSKNTKTPCDDFLEAVNMIKALQGECIIFIKDIHRILNQDITLIRTLKNLAPLMEASFRTIVFISPVVEIPIELEKNIQLIDFDLPSIEELEELATTIARDNDMDFEIKREVIEAAKGLTMEEAKNTFSRSIISTKKYDRKIIKESMLQTVKKSGLMEIYTPVPIEEIGGLDTLKQYIFSRMRGFTDVNLPTPKGVLLTGVAGSGKSLSAKAIASVFGVDLIKLDFGSLKAGLVGKSQENAKRAFAMIDAIGKCVVWLDEIEKALAGVASSGRTDGGTGADMFGMLLTWMQESKSEKYIVATCNDIEDLLALSQGALIRRFDDIFFVDLPTANERKLILDIMIKRYKADKLDYSNVEMNNWTGAEIEKFVINSLYDGVEVARDNMRPIAEQNKAIINKAREWAKYNAICANEAQVTVKTGRSLKV